MDSSATAAAVGLSTIGQIAVTVRDVDRAIAYYRDVLGLRLLFQVANMGFFDCDGIRLMLSGTDKPEPPGNSILYFKVAQIQTTYDAVTTRGAISERQPHLVAHMPDHDLWMAFLRDQDQNLIGLMSELPRA